MKLLLTSAGITNPSIVKALSSLTGKSFQKLKLVFVPTAVNVEKGDKSWYIQDLSNCDHLGFSSIDVVDISALPQNVWEPRIQDAHIIQFGGGNTYYLAYWLRKSGLGTMLPKLLQTKIYVGTSAGSIVASPSLTMSSSEPGTFKDEPGLNLVKFHIRPHLYSRNFPQIKKKRLEKIASELRAPIYYLDDQSAIKVVDKKIEVVSEGDYFVANPK
jgi:dipeptidase E